MWLKPDAQVVSGNGISLLGLVGRVELIRNGAALIIVKNVELGNRSPLVFTREGEKCGVPRSNFGRIGSTYFSLFFNGVRSPCE